MAKICAACCKIITTAQSMQCTRCTSTYHHLCVNINDPRKLTESEKNDWICPVCQSKIPKKGNSNTPVRASSVPSENAASNTTNSSTNVTLRPQNRKVTTPLLSPVNAEPDALTSLITEVKLLRQDMSKMSEHLQSLTSSFTQCNTRLDEQEGRFDALAKRIQILETREIENEALRLKVTELEELLNFQAQARLGNEIEIVGVNECPNENKIHILLTTAQKMGVPLSEMDVNHVTRVGPKRSLGEDSMPRPLVVKFVRRAKRNEFLKAAMSRRNLTSSSINVEGPSRKLYFNERLTKSNRRLFREARVQSNNAGYKFCWTRNGTILTRKKQGSPEIVIRSMADLHTRIKTCSEKPGVAERPRIASTGEDQEQTVSE